ncbi:MAG: EF-hand domain-containing protein [Parvularculaceae bacterium]
MKTTAFLLSAVSAVLFAASGALAGGHGKRGGHWDRLDANDDGKITAEEMDDHQAEFFAGADADGDGAITREEMKAFHKARRAEHMRERMGDANGDGVVERDEYMDAAAERFDKLDKNEDGVLSEDELAPMHHKRHRRGARKD